MTPVPPATSAQAHTPHLPASPDAAAHASPEWVFEHVCPHCTYTHRVAFSSAPDAKIEYTCKCPYSGKDVVFGVLEAVVCGAAPRFGAVWAHPVA